jgi:hypothetical protein
LHFTTGASSWSEIKTKKKRSKAHGTNSLAKKKRSLISAVEKKTTVSDHLDVNDWLNEDEKDYG